MLKGFASRLLKSSYESIQKHRFYSTFDVWFFEKLKWIGMHKNYFISLPILNLLGYGFYKYNTEKANRFVAYDMNSIHNPIKNIIAMNFSNNDWKGLLLDSIIVSASAFHLEKVYGSPTVFKATVLSFLASYVVISLISQIRIQFLKEAKSKDDKNYFVSTHGIATGLMSFALSRRIGVIGLLVLSIIDGAFITKHFYSHGGYIGGFTSFLIF
jgi:hypothetical protein